MQNNLISNRNQINTPVVVFICRRPDKFSKLLDVLATVQPKDVFIVADGPRDKYPDDQVKVSKTRELIKEISWPCRLETNFSDINLGGPKRIPSGLDWVFSKVDQTIILEDDILPHSSFFYFCEELLHVYKYDKRVMHISGGNRGVSDLTEYSYYFARSPRVKGWATWARAWKLFDNKMSSWPLVREQGILKYPYLTNKHYKIKVSVWDSFYNNQRDNWDLKWDYSIAINNGLVIVPNVNLTENIGFGADAQHSFNYNSWELPQKANSMKFPLVHPPYIVPNLAADYACYKIQRSNIKKIVKILEKFLPFRAKKNL